MLMANGVDVVPRAMQNSVSMVQILYMLFMWWTSRTVSKVDPFGLIHATSAWNGIVMPTRFLRSTKGPAGCAS
jgi:hypothetical protein